VNVNPTNASEPSARIERTAEATRSLDDLQTRLVTGQKRAYLLLRVRGFIESSEDLAKALLKRAAMLRGPDEDIQGHCRAPTAMTKRARKKTSFRGQARPGPCASHCALACRLTRPHRTAARRLRELYSEAALILTPIPHRRCQPIEEPSKPAIVDAMIVGNRHRATGLERRLRTVAAARFRNQATLDNSFVVNSSTNSGLHRVTITDLV